MRDASKIAWRKLAGKRHIRSGHIDIHMRVHGKKKFAKAHQLILFAFVGPKPNGMECRHLNGNPADNRLENLVWGTRRENVFDSIKHGVFPKGGNIQKYNDRRKAEKVGAA